MNTTGKRLAKNTAFMYIRMFVLIVVSFYTSRIVLQQLGVEDYGIYNLVGSIVAMFNSLRAIFASSTQRYLNYEMGQQNESNLKLVFNLSIYINLCIAAIFILLVEIMGIWFFTKEINIAPNRLQPAYIMFQCAVAIAAISVITSVFDAEIIAHERMNFYAGLAIVEGLMKLGIVFLLAHAPIDRLSFYGILLLGVSCIVFAINYIYCRINFQEVKLCRLWDKDYLKKMTQFAGWNFLGNTAYAITQNGLNMVLNVFGGAAVNAARGIAFQVSEMTKQFLTNINTIMTPYSIKAYACEKYDEFEKAIFMSSKILFFVQLMLTIPLTYLTPWLLQLWLGQVPEYSVIFLRLIMIICLIRSIHGPIDTIFKSHGDLRWYQIAEGIILSLPLIFSYIFLLHGAPFAIVFVCSIIFEFINLISILILASKIASYDSIRYIKTVILPALVCTLSAGIMFYISTLLTIWWEQCITTIASMLLCSFIWWILMISHTERKYIVSLIPQKYAHRTR